MKILNILKYSTLGLFGLFAILIIWGLIEPYFIDVEEETVVIPNLPPAWEGKSIGQLTDFQEIGKVTEIIRPLIKENTGRRQVDEVHSPCSVLPAPLHYKDMRCTSRL